MVSGRTAWDYPADGIVIETENLSERGRLGYGSKGPNWATAFKFASPSASTRIREIVWQTGAAGRITPVAVFDPVELDGRTISRASLYSAAYVAEHEFKAGDEVIVALKGHVIPVVMKDSCD